MKKLIALVFVALTTSAVNAQDDEPATVQTRAQLLRLQATITPAWCVTLLSGNDSIQSISSGKTNVYLHGTAEYYWDERFSTRGDMYFLLTKTSKPGGVKYNHGVQVGVSYHFLQRGYIDPFFGVRGGLNMTQVTPFGMTDGIDTVLVTPPIKLDPTWAPVVGINFYSPRIFHFFIECAWMQGTYRPNVGPQRSLEEFRLSAGLGFNFSFARQANNVRQKI